MFSSNQLERLRACREKVGSHLWLTALMVFIPLCSTGCWHVRGNGKITASVGLAHPLADVTAVHEAAIRKFNTLETGGQLNAGGINERLGESLQRVTRVRGSGAVDLTPGAAAAAAPPLPEAESATLSGEQFSAARDAITFADSIKLSPFAMISDTRDIYETLVPAHLRFQFEQLRKSDYEFYFVPITVSIDPGKRTRKNYVADVEFSFSEMFAGEAEALPASTSLRSLLRGMSPDFDTIDTDQVLQGMESPSEEEALRTLTSTLTSSSKVDDIRVFTISPLRQFSRRAETLARRIQGEQALLFALSGPLGEAGSAATQGQFDRIERLESDYARITANPELTGYTDNERTCGWRIHPSLQLENGEYRSNKLLTPGPRDLLVVIAVKRMGGDVPRHPLEAFGYTPSITLRGTYKARWVQENPLLPVLTKEFLPENIPSNWDDLNSGSGYEYEESERFFYTKKSVLRYSFEGAMAGLGFLFDPRETSNYEQWNGYANFRLRIPGTPPLPLLNAQSMPLNQGTPERDALGNQIGFKIDGSKPFLLTIEGGTYTSNTHVQFRGQLLKPENFTPNQLTVVIPAVKDADKLGKYNVVVVASHDPARIKALPDHYMKSAGLLSVVGASEPEKPSLTLTASAVVLPGSIVKLQVKDPAKNFKLPAMDKLGELAVHLGGVPIPSSDILVFDPISGIFGFHAPRLAEGSGKVLDISVKFLNNKGLVLSADRPLVYAAEQPDKARPLALSLQ